jgi:hypothetical protein
MASKLDDQVGRAIKPAESADTPPSILIKTYTGKQGEATALFQADSIEMAAKGYFPTWQSWAPGEWTREAYVIAVLLILLFGMGIFRLAYLVIVEPDGILTVTYERRPAAVKEKYTRDARSVYQRAALLAMTRGMPSKTFSTSAKFADGMASDYI